MEQFQELCIRIYDIEQCIINAYSRNYEKRAILELAARLSALEKHVTDLELKVDSQLLDSERVGETIAKMKQIYSICESCNIIPTQLDPVEIISKSVQKAKITTQSEEKPMIKNTPSLISYATQDDIDSTKSFVSIRVSLDKVNAWIDEINTMISKKQSILKTPTNQIKSSTRPLWERYKDEALENDDRLFFTEIDINDLPTLKTNSKKALTLLRTMGKIYEETEGKIKRYFVR